MPGRTRAKTARRGATRPQKAATDGRDAMSDSDAFQTLGLRRDASTQDVKNAYRSLAKKHHPDVNPGDAAAAERFKRMTSAYTQALLISAKREREPQGSTAGPSSSGQPRPRARTTYGSPRAAAGQTVDEKRFNVREWESAHYGLKGRTAEERQSQYVRNLYRQQRARQQSASSFYARARSAAASSGAAAAGGSTRHPWLFTISAAICASVWSMVYSTNFGYLRTRDSSAGPPSGRRR